MDRPLGIHDRAVALQEIEEGDRKYLRYADEGYLGYEARLAFLASCSDEMALGVLVDVYFAEPDLDSYALAAIKLPSTSIH